MQSRHGGTMLPLMAAAAMAFAIAGAQAQQPTQHKEITGPETAYQAGGSPLAGVDMYQDINPKAPPMIEGGVRQGAPDLLRALRRLPRRAAQGRDRQAAHARTSRSTSGTEYLKVFIKYGSPAGMPNWGTSGDLNDAEVDLMARYVQQTPPHPARVRHEGDEGDLEGRSCRRTSARRRR